MSGVLLKPCALRGLLREGMQGIKSEPRIESSTKNKMSM